MLDVVIRDLIILISIREELQGLRGQLTLVASVLVASSLVISWT